jgi:uncharacterized repeat protein (TIGR03803 family)
VLDAFVGQPSGAGGAAGDLVPGPHGVWFGSTADGGQGWNGSLYATDLAGHHRELHSFAYQEGGGINGSLVLTPDGSLYGTAQWGGTPGDGTVFRFSRDGVLTVLHDFDSTDGDMPKAGLLLASDGWLYGTTVAGGADQQGTLFRISLDGVFESLHSFAATGDQPYNPSGRLVEAPDGSLVGTTFSGGPGRGGTVFRRAPDGTVSVIASFSTRDGGPSGPSAGLFDGHDGWWYGTSNYGGAAGNGTVYRVALDGRVELLHAFAADAHDGRWPLTELHGGTDGRLYGTAWQGGGADNCGTAFRIDRAGHFELLRAFDDADGCGLWSGLVQAGPHAFIGAAGSRGPAGHGDAFVLTPP